MIFYEKNKKKERMLCFSQKFCLPCCQETEELGREKPTIERIDSAVITISPKKKGQEIDSNSESDSGLGSVQDSNDSGNSSTDSGKEEINAKSARTKPKRSESLLSRFSVIFSNPASDKLSDMLVEDLKKTNRSNGIALERLFDDKGVKIPAIPEIAKSEVQKKLKKKKSFKQLFTKEVQEPLPEENSQTMDQEKNNFVNQNAFDPQSTPEMEHESQRKQKRRQKRRPVQKIIESSSRESL